MRTHRHLRLSFLFHMTLKGIWRKKLRTFLTLLGVTIGIGALTFLLSFGYGLQRLVAGELADSKAVRTIDVTSTKSKVVRLDPSTVDKIRSVDNVTSVSSVYSAAGRAEVGAQASRDVIVFGVDAEYLEVMSARPLAGDVRTGLANNDAIVNQVLVQAAGIADPAQALGQQLDVVARGVRSADGTVDIPMTVTIRGVSESGERAELYVSNAQFTDGGAAAASQLKVFSTNRDDVPDIRSQIESLGLTTSSPVDTLESVQQLFRVLTIVLVGFGSIGIAVAMLGMFNTLTITLIERTKEIGLMVSMGARRRDIRRLVVVEGFVLALLGGIIGLGGAIGLSAIGNQVIGRIARGRGATEDVAIFYTSPQLAVMALVLASAIGIIVAAYPAQRAVRINPIRALRQD